MARSGIDQALQHPLAKLWWWGVALLPLAWLVFAVLTDNLGANPAEALIRSSGDWALRGLCITLAVTPLRQLTGWQSLARFRRVVGLFAYFYVAVHVACYAWLDMGWQWHVLLQDLAQRPFIWVGALALGVLTLLAATSPKAIVKSIGGRNWQCLHQGVHLAAWLALLHFFWMRASKNTLQEVWIYAAVIGLLQAWRIVRRWYSTEKR